jgi:hypothetical protein
MRRIKLILAALAMFVGLNSALPAMALADTSKSTVCTALGSDANCTTDPHGSTNLNSVIKTIVNILSWVVGIVAVIMIIIAGFRYVTAGGDSSNVASAKNTLIYAIVGLVVAASAQIIVHFVLNQVNNNGCPAGKTYNSTLKKCV